MTYLDRNDDTPPSATDVDKKSSGDIGRRTALSCMLWAGAGVIWTLNAGVPMSTLLGIADAHAMDDTTTTSSKTPSSYTRAFSFIQISDSHIGFHKDPNMDPAATLQVAVDRIRRGSEKPAFLIHTGDISHLSKPDEFDTATQIIGEAGVDVHYVPGEHDVLIDNGAAYAQRFRPGAQRPWYSFDQGGVHFIGLVNVLDLHGGGLGFLGDEQLAWLRNDLSRRSTSTPLVVFAHIPLWSIYPAWGWGTDDSAKALALMQRFGSVTVLNGHIHQVMQKVEGDMCFYTARSTAFPQPAPGTATGPGPMKVPADKLRTMLGLRSVDVVPTRTALAVTDTTLVA